MVNLLRYWFRHHNDNELMVTNYFDSDGKVRKIKLIFRMGYLTHRSTIYRDNLEDLHVYKQFFKTTYKENGYWIRTYNCYDGNCVEKSSEQFVC